MSLSRILNDEGPSQPHQRPIRLSTSPRPLPVNSVIHPSQNPTWVTEHQQPLPQQVHPHPIHVADTRPPPQMHDDYFHNESFHGPTVWVSDAQSILQPSLPLESNTEPDTEPSRFGLPPESWAPFGSKDAARRRRRKLMADEAEARAQASRRAKRPKRAPSRVGEPNPVPELEMEEPVKLTEEEMRLQSTDLEDCEEIWIAELADYVLETRKRENVIENEFETSTLAANSDIATQLSRNYVMRMNSIPLRQPTPPQPPPPGPPPDQPGPGGSPHQAPAPSRHPSEEHTDRAQPTTEPAQAEWVSYDRFPEDLARTKHPYNQEEEPSQPQQQQQAQASPLIQPSQALPQQQAQAQRSGHYPPDDFPRPLGEARSNNYYRNRNELQFNEYVPPTETVSTGRTIFIEEGVPGAKKARTKEKAKEKEKPKPKLADKGKGKAKASPSDAESEAVEEKTVQAEKNGDEPAAKKRKLDNGESVPSAVPHVPEREPSPARSMTAPVPRSDTPDSVSSKLATTTKKKSNKKKNEGMTLTEAMEAEFGPTVSASLAVPPPATVAFESATAPVPSRPTSPAPTGFMSLIYEIGGDIPPLRKAKKADNTTLVKRVKTLEESQKKVWTNIARRDIAKAYKFHAQGYQARQSQMDRVAKLASMQARKPFVKTTKASKDIQTKARRLMREMQVFWKKNEREERDVRKREQKEAHDRAKIEEEAREAARQARKLEFLISQTELYSHFVGSKLKTSELEGEENSTAVPAGAQLEDVNPSALKEIDFNDEDTTNLHHHARRNAQEAIEMAKQRALDFDNQAALERKTNEALQLAKGQAHIRDDASESASQVETNGPGLVDLDSDELNFQNPTSLSGPLTIGQPKLLMAQLKEYQLKGLNWLATLYEQGINGILADEMGLGKTIQSISLIAYLAETHDIWGPFLVVAPSSTLHNWQQELTRFVPSIKALPYWGNPKDRATLRKFWSKKEISYNQDAPFHVLITSYNLITQDQQYFQRVKWQYMILDEAQNIKNSASVRWKTLLGLQCRNRLLLTGTPIQNSMQELWALLHFIMPSLFDSHDEFNEWFSKDIESAAENKGSGLGEHQLRRLHMILKPFMLRRVKRHVQNELSEKIELDIFVDLSARQRSLYKTLLSNVSITDLLARATNLGDAESARTLMNLVMQFRKVCNHPELFERADIVAPYSFCAFGRPSPPNREGDSVILPYSTHNPIEYSIPRLFYEDGGLQDIPRENSTNPSRSISQLKTLNIWHSEWIHRSQYGPNADSAFAFLRLKSTSTASACSSHSSSIIRRIIAGVHESIAAQLEEDFLENSESFLTAKATSNPFHLQAQPRLLRLDGRDDQLPPPSDIGLSAWRYSCLSRPELKCYIPRVVAPPISMYCSDRNFVEQQERLVEAPLESLIFFGITPRLQESEEACNSFHKRMQGVPTNGILGASSADQLPATAMTVPQAKKLIYDSAKLARLDSLLQELKAGDHRVLIYFQMTRMMDLMEEYLVYRQYKYLRLDGSSKIEDRRDMVMDWQTRPDIFIFILSTRAGGLGINLTAADTVIFYDHDWNPSNDAQAMDRAHRLGQTRQVTVYRLITKGTIDERIVQLARVKKDVQDIVVGNKNLADMAKPKDIAQLLLNDEQLADLGTSDSGGGTPVPGLTAGGDAWNDEGDDFFGHSTSAAAMPAETPAEEDVPVANGSVRGKRRRGGKTGAPRGRKPAGTSRRKRGGAATGYTM